MIVLKHIGSVLVSAMNDYLLVQCDLSTDLTDRSAWPSEVLADPQGLRFAIDVVHCIEMGFAEESSGEVRIPYKYFPDIRHADIGLAEEWSKRSPFLLKIGRISDIGRPDFKYRYSFLYDRMPIQFDREGYYGTAPGFGGVFCLDDQTYALVTEMDRFNVLPPGSKSRSESWLSFSTIKGCAIDVGARLDSYLQSNDVIVPRQLGLEVHTWDDGSVSFVPAIPEIDGPGLKNQFFNFPKAQDTYDVDGPENSRLRVVFNDRQKQVLDRMKDVGRRTGEVRDQMLNSPSDFFEGDMMDVVDIHYGRRVIGIGKLSLTSAPGAPRDKSILDTGDKAFAPAQAGSVTVTTLDGEQNSIRFTSNSEKQDFVSTAIATRDAGNSSFVFNGKSVQLNDDLKAYILIEEERKKKAIERSDGDDKYLQTYQNVDELKQWDVDDVTNAFRRPAYKSRGPVLPSCLIPGKELMSHQLDGLEWLQLCHEQRIVGRRGSILADDMGLGKTLQLLNYLAWCIENDKDLGLSNEDAPWRPVLIVLPLILLENKTWEKEITGWFKHGGVIFSPVLVAYGDEIKKLRELSRGKETALGRPLIPAERFMRNRLVITNYETIVQYQHSFAQNIPGTRKSIWSVMITDEASRYKSPATKISEAMRALRADVHIACTGTPVENSMLDLWNITDIVQPALLDERDKFLKKYEPRDGAPVDLSELKRTLLFQCDNTFILRRTKEVLNLPAKTFEPLYADMTEWEVSSHLDLLASVGNGDGSKLRALHKLSDLYRHPALYEERVDAVAFANPNRLLAESAKLRAVIKKLREIQRVGEKAIIFEYRIPMQQILSEVIGSQFGIEVDTINGNSSSDGKSGAVGSKQSKKVRERKLERFKEKRGFNVIIISQKAAGIGLTITAANHVVHYGRWWNPALESQATDRAYRKGQEKPVHVYFPILRDPSGKLPRSFDQGLEELISDKQGKADDFLTPMEPENNLGLELFDKLIGCGIKNTSTPIASSDVVDQLDPFHFESLVACILEAEGHKAILTTRSGDQGADVISFYDNQVWLVQVKHTVKGGIIGREAISDILAASDNYSEHIKYSARLLAVTNGTFERDVKTEANHLGVLLIDRRELMERLRSVKVTPAAVRLKETERCVTFNDGIVKAISWLS